MQNRKLVYMITNEVISELRNAIASLQVRENERRAMLKDVRLLEAALEPVMNWTRVFAPEVPLR